MEHRSDFVFYKIFKGCARLAIAETCSSEPPPSSESLNPALSLEFGLGCIENALVLLPRKVPDDEDFSRLQQSILLAGAFIALKLKRFSKSAEYARKCITVKSSLLASFYLVSFGHLFGEKYSKSNFC